MGIADSIRGKAQTKICFVHRPKTKSNTIEPSFHETARSMFSIQSPAFDSRFVISLYRWRLLPILTNRIPLAQFRPYFGTDKTPSFQHTHKSCSSKLLVISDLGYPTCPEKHNHLSSMRNLYTLQKEESMVPSQPLMLDREPQNKTPAFIRTAEGYIRRPQPGVARRTGKIQTMASSRDTLSPASNHSTIQHSTRLSHHLRQRYSQLVA
jgi:hypothetical protein